MSTASESFRPGAERLARTFRDGDVGGFRSISDFAGCLMPLVSALGWRGRRRELAEAMPHFADSLDLVALRNTLANLNYDSTPLRVRLDALDARLAPLLFVPDQGSPFVLLRHLAPSAPSEAHVEIYCGQAGLQTRPLEAISGTAYLFRRTAREAESRPQHGEASWFAHFIRRFRRAALHVLAASAALNLLALAVPLFVMAAYDHAIASGSGLTLASLAIGIALGLGADLALRALRGCAASRLAGRLEALIGTAAFQQILHLPAPMTERAPIGVQVSRLREFDSVRELFAGHLGVAVLDLPFAFVFVLAIAILAGPLAVIPLGMILAYAILGLCLFPHLRGRIAATTAASAKRQSTIVETVTHIRAIKLAGGEDTWRLRYRENSAALAMAKFQLARAQSLIMTCATLLMASGGLATIVWGAVRVTDGAMTVGALIACMMLVWRALGPLHTAFMAWPRLDQALGAIRQLNGLMRLRPERDPRAPAPQRSIKGRVGFRRVSMRYSAESEPAVLGVSFDVEAGECAAIVGPSGAGKSTILKLVAGLYQAQAGLVLIDDIDSRQFDPVALRQNIAYLPQEAHLFHGTVAQNLRLAEPAATDEQLRAAAERAGVLAEIEALPNGFETRFGDQALRQLPAGFRQRIQLARVYLKDAPIVLMDEPSSALDAEGDAAFRAMIERLKGRATVILVTHRPSHMEMADKVFVLDDGVLRLAGPPARVVPHLRGEYK